MQNQPNSTNVYNNQVSPNPIMATGVPPMVSGLGMYGLEDHCRTLYVGNLDPRVTDAMLLGIFSAAGLVVSAKIIPDKNLGHGGLNYGFVEYWDRATAENAIGMMNGRRIFNVEIRVNWAHQSINAVKEDTSNHFHVFVGDLSPDINDQHLSKAFSVFPSLSDARVMWDQNTGKSRGYGFVAFRDKADAEKAISTMNGEWLGNRAIRVNWANHKTNVTSVATTNPPVTYETIAQQTPQYNTTVYCGNLTPLTTQGHLIPFFAQHGFITEIRMQADRGFAFVRMDTHENAARAIFHLNGVTINGRQVKCSWGKERIDGGPVIPVSAPAAPVGSLSASSTNYSYAQSGYPYPTQSTYGEPNTNPWGGYTGYEQYSQYYAGAQPYSTASPFSAQPSAAPQPPQ